MDKISFLDGKIKIFRPFLDENKKSLNFITNKIFGTYVKDPSNYNKKFLRSNVRRLLPLLKKHGIKDDQIIKSINNLKSSSKTINFYFNSVFDKVEKEREKNFYKNSLFSLSEESIKSARHVIKL